jgi:hypothetical protein
LLLLVLPLVVQMMDADPGLAQWLVEERVILGSDVVTFGLETSRFRVSVLGTKSVIATDDQLYDSLPYRLIDSDLRGTAVSFDLKLRWPSSSAPGTSGVGPVEPYLSFGPTLFASGFDTTPRLGQPGRRPDGSLSLGLHWGAGLSWRLSRNAELFGGYRFVQSSRENALPHGERSSSETDLIGHDVLYGLSIRF